MCGGGSYHAPTPPPPPPPPDPPAVENNEEVEKAKNNQRKAQLAAQGRHSTILTGALGDTSEANVSKKQLLGQ